MASLDLEDGDAASARPISTSPSTPWRIGGRFSDGIRRRDCTRTRRRRLAPQCWTRVPGADRERLAALRTRSQAPGNSVSAHPEPRPAHSTPRREPIDRQPTRPRLSPSTSLGAHRAPLPIRAAQGRAPLRVTRTRRRASPRRARSRRSIPRHVGRPEDAVWV